jgi:anti-anti-sigma factor
MPEPVVVHPESVLNQTEAHRFAKELDAAITDGAKVVVVDCERVQYMNTRAMGALIDAYKRLLQRGGILRLVRPGGFLRRCLEAIGVWSLLETFDDLDEALRGRNESTE